MKFRLAEVTSDNRHTNAAVSGAAQQVPGFAQYAATRHKQLGTSTRAPAANAVAGQQGSISNVVNAAQQQSCHTAGEQVTVTDSRTGISGNAAADKKRSSSQREAAPTGNTSNKMHVEAAPLGASAGSSKGFK